MAGLVAVGLAAAGCGEAFGTGGAGGSGSTSTSGHGGSGSTGTHSTASATGSSTVSATSGGSTGTGVGGCMSNKDCKEIEFCERAQCDAPTGECKVRPAEVAPRDLHCGCDGVTYWNKSVAGAHGVNVAGLGACMGTAILCNQGGMQCDATGSHCRLQVNNPATGCNGGTLAGSCWQVPKSCDQTVDKSQLCNGTCDLTCKLITDGTPFHSIVGSCL